MKRSFYVILAVLVLSSPLLASERLKKQIGEEQYSSIVKLSGQRFVDTYGDLISGFLEKSTINELAKEHAQAKTVDERIAVNTKLRNLRALLNDNLKEVYPNETRRKEIVEIIASESALRQRSGVAKDEIARREEERLADEAKRAEEAELERQRQAALRAQAEAAEQRRRAEELAGITGRQAPDAIGRMADLEKARIKRAAELLQQVDGKPVKKPNSKTMDWLEAFIAFSTPMPEDATLNRWAKVGAGASGIVLIEALNHHMKRKGSKFQKGKLWKGARFGGHALAIWAIASGFGSAYKNQQRADQIKKFLESETFKAMEESMGRREALRLTNDFIARQGNMNALIMKYSDEADKEQLQALINEERKAFEPLLKDYIKDEETRKIELDRIAGMRAFIRLQAINSGDVEQAAQLLEEMRQEIEASVKAGEGVPHADPMGAHK